MQIINPKLREEARWLDGILTERDLHDRAAMKGLDVHVEAEPPVYSPSRGYDAAALRLIVGGKDRRVRDAEQQLERARAEAQKWRDKLTDRLNQDAREKGVAA